MTIGQMLRSLAELVVFLALVLSIIAAVVVADAALNGRPS